MNKHKEECDHSHTPSHNHDHDHNHFHNANKKALLISFILIFTFMIIEFIGGYFTNSLALISDAGHMLSDAAALGLSLAAIIFGQKKADKQKTYGYKRFEILAALINAIVLLLISFFIIKEAFVRFSNPSSVQGKGMIIIAVIGLIVNIIVAWILSRGEIKENLNVKSAFMHVIGDMLGSIGAIIAALLIMFFNWTIADAIASIIVSLLILYSGWNILKDSINVLMEGVPPSINIENITKELLKIPGIISIHDLHVWIISSDFLSLSSHIQVDNEVDRDKILEILNHKIEKDFGIKHITIQIEGKEFICNYQLTCGGGC